VHIGFLSAIVAAANAGGAGSVVEDTTTTMMWIDGISPSSVFDAYRMQVNAPLLGRCRAPSSVMNSRRFISNMGLSSAPTSLDRTVCTKERQGWNREAQRARRFEIYDERKARRLFDRDIARLGSFQNLIDQRRHLTKSTAQESDVALLLGASCAHRRHAPLPRFGAGHPSD
jgi:hypothetical protein